VSAFQQTQRAAVVPANSTAFWSAELSTIHAAERTTEQQTKYTAFLSAFITTYGATI
jgi:hypothetical protein